MSDHEDVLRDAESAVYSYDAPVEHHLLARARDAATKDLMLLGDQIASMHKLLDEAGVGREGAIADRLADHLARTAPREAEATYATFARVPGAIPEAAPALEDSLKGLGFQKPESSLQTLQTAVHSLWRRCASRTAIAPTSPIKQLEAVHSALERAWEAEERARDLAEGRRGDGVQQEIDSLFLRSPKDCLAPRACTCPGCTVRRLTKWSNLDGKEGR